MDFLFFLIINKDVFFLFIWNINKDVVPKKGEDVISYAQNFFHSPIKEKKKKTFSIVVRMLTNKDGFNSLHLSQNTQELLFFFFLVNTGALLLSGI